MAKAVIYWIESSLTLAKAATRRPAIAALASVWLPELAGDYLRLSVCIRFSLENIQKVESLPDCLHNVYAEHDMTLADIGAACV